MRNGSFNPIFLEIKPFLFRKQFSPQFLLKCLISRPIMNLQSIYLNGEVIRGAFLATLMFTFQHRYHLVHRMFVSAQLTFLLQKLESVFDRCNLCRHPQRRFFRVFQLDERDCQLGSQMVRHEAFD